MLRVGGPPTNQPSDASVKNCSSLNTSATRPLGRFDLQSPLNVNSFAGGSGATTVESRGPKEKAPADTATARTPANGSSRARRTLVDPTGVIPPVVRMGFTAISARHRGIGPRLSTVVAPL